MTHRVPPSSGPAPRAHKATAAQGQRRGFMARLFGRREQPQTGDKAQALRHNLAQRLPTTDPLRAARLQTHLFLGQLPAFPRPQDTPQDTSSPTSPSAGQEAQDLSALRTEKQQRETLRAAAEAQAAQDPARQRMETLRSRREKELQAVNNRPKSAVTPSRSAAPSRATQAAAARTPARLALNQVASGQGMAISSRQGGGLADDQGWVSASIPSCCWWPSSRCCWP